MGDGAPSDQTHEEEPCCWCSIGHRLSRSAAEPSTIGIYILAHPPRSQSGNIIKKGEGLLAGGSTPTTTHQGAIDDDDEDAGGAREERELSL